VLRVDEILKPYRSLCRTPTDPEELARVLGMASVERVLAGADPARYGYRGG
jgi:hypothetical protein